MARFEVIDNPYGDTDQIAEELTDKTEVDSQDPEDIVGTESFTEKLMDKSQMGVGVMVRPNVRRVFVRTSDHKNFRVYIRSDIQFDPSVINRICRFLDTRSASDTVTFILGVDADENSTPMIGPIISSVASCKAKTIGIAAGLCGMTETMIWTFCNERIMFRYGAITFGKPEFLKDCKEYGPYYDTFFNKAIELGLLTKDKLDEIYTQNKTVMIMSDEYNK